MRNFIKLSPNFWVGATGRALRKAGPEAQLVALYLLSNPHVNYIGMYRLSLAYASADLAIPVDRLRELFAAVAATDFAVYDAESETAWVYEAAAHQIGALVAKDKRIVAAQSEFESLPNDCPYLQSFYDKYRVALHLKARKGMQSVSPKAVEPLPAPSANAAAAKKAASASTPARRDTGTVQLPEAASSADRELVETLKCLLRASEAAGLSDSDSEYELASRLLQLARDESALIVREMIEAALATEDYAMSNFDKHYAAAHADDI